MFPLLVCYQPLLQLPSEIKIPDAAPPPSPSPPPHLTSFPGFGHPLVVI